VWFQEVVFGELAKKREWDRSPLEDLGARWC